MLRHESGHLTLVFCMTHEHNETRAIDSADQQQHQHFIARMHSGGSSTKFVPASLFMMTAATQKVRHEIVLLPAAALCQTHVATSSLISRPSRLHPPCLACAAFQVVVNGHFEICKLWASTHRYERLLLSRLINQWIGHLTNK
jgi:hypothetical protein